MRSWKFSKQINGCKKPLFVSLAPYFFDESGHDRVYHQELQTALAYYGWQVTSLVPLHCQVRSLPSSWVYYFHNSRYQPFRFFYRLFDFWRLTRTLKKKSPQAVLLLESYTSLDLLAMYIAFILVKPHSIRFWHIVRDGLEHSPWKQKFHAQLLRLLHTTLTTRYRLFTDSAKAAATLQPLITSTFTLLPIPHVSLQPAQTRSSQKIALWLPGQPRPEKGLQEILRLFSHSDPALEQCELWAGKTQELLPIRAHTRWIAPMLSRAEYLQTLFQADALLLPYDPLLYRSRTSGPFVEAIVGGKIAFVKEGSWLASELTEHHLTECILDWKDPSTLSRILFLLQDQTLHTKLQKMQQVYRQFHSPEVFRERLSVGKIT